MITEIPQKNDFIDSGIAYFNLSYDILINLVIDLYNIENYSLEKINKNKYWNSSKRRVLNSIVLLQQGTEHILKGLISEISPFILLKDLTKISDKNDIAFSDLKTIDAQDLIKVYNACSKRELNIKLAKEFEEIRIIRNKITHGTGNDINLKARDVIVKLLSIYNYIFSDKSWLDTRKRFIEDNSIIEIQTHKETETILMNEYYFVSTLLSKSEIKLIFNNNERQKLYICPECYNYCEMDDLYPKTAVLKPNNKKSNTIFVMNIILGSMLGLLDKKIITKA